MYGVGEWVFRHSHYDQRKPAGFLWLNYDVQAVSDAVEGEDPYTARCRELGISSSGADWLEALQACRDAVLVTLNSVEEDNEIDQYLRELGVQLEPDPPDVFEGDFPQSGNGGYREPVERMVAAR